MTEPPSVKAMLNNGPTAPLAEFVAAYEADDNLWWVVGCGHHQNLFDAAMEEVDRLRAFERFLYAQAEMYGPAASLTASLSAYERTQ
jgi:hypothetical protein